MQDGVGLGLVLLHRLALVLGVPPRRVEHLGEVLEAQPARGLIEARKVEEDVGLHGREQREARHLGRLVQELGARDSAVGALDAGLANDELDEVDLLDHVLERADVGVRDLAALRDVAQRAEVLDEVVRQLVLGRLEDDALEVLGVDEAVAVRVEQLEGLADALALQAAQHLAELVVVQLLARLLHARVQPRPLAVPVEGDAIGAFVHLVQLLEVGVVDGPRAVDVEEAEGDFVLGVRFVKQVLERAPVADVHLAAAAAVGDMEEDAVLLPLDLVLQRMFVRGSNGRDRTGWG